MFRTIKVKRKDLFFSSLALNGDGEYKMEQFVSCLEGKFDLLNYCRRSQVLLILKNAYYELQRVFGMPKK